MASEEVADLVGDLLDDDSKVFVVRDRKLEVIVNDLAVEIHELDLALEGGRPDPTQIMSGILACSPVEVYLVAIAATRSSAWCLSTLIHPPCFLIGCIPRVADG